MISPYWNRQRYRRLHPLTEKAARTTAEIDAEGNPASWFEGPDDEAQFRWPTLGQSLWWIAAFALLYLALYVLPRVWTS